MNRSEPRRLPSSLQFSLSTLLLVAVTVGIVVGTLADEFRVAEQMRQRVNGYTLHWWDHRETMTREEVRTWLGANPTADTAGTSEETFRWNGWLFAHEIRITYDGDHPGRTVAAHVPRLGAGSVVLLLVAGLWCWRLVRRRRQVAPAS